MVLISNGTINFFGFFFEKLEFNQNEYIKQYNKNNYKKISVYLSKQKFEMLNALLTQNNMSKNELFKIALYLLEEGKIIKEEEDN